MMQGSNEPPGFSTKSERYSYTLCVIGKKGADPSRQSKWFLACTLLVIDANGASSTQERLRRARCKPRRFVMAVPLLWFR